MGFSIRYPFKKALFPPEFPAPTFEWNVAVKDYTPWDVSLVTGNNKYSVNATTRNTLWTPDESKWDSLKILSDYGKIYFTVKKSGTEGPSAKVEFSISHDTVGAPILYRQMPIPFILAEKNLDSMNFMLIKIGSRNRPHVAMRGFPVCGNCHSFSADGSTIGLDLDAGLRDKGGSSKGMSVYTDMFLTHIDENGNDGLPVLVGKARFPYRVINYPEFVNRKPGDTFVMEYDYVEMAHIRRALKKGNIEKAKTLFLQLEEQNPFFFSEDCLELSDMLKKMGMKKES